MNEYIQTKYTNPLYYNESYILPNICSSKPDNHTDAVCVEDKEKYKTTLIVLLHYPHIYRHTLDLRLNALPETARNSRHRKLSSL